MDKIKCVVTDDEKIARQGMVDYVSQVPFLELVAECRSAIELTACLQENPVDLVFLDIQMPGLTGIDWAKYNVDTPGLIFTTAYREYSLDSYEVNAIDYLLKPIAFPRFLQACQKAKQLLMSEPTTEKMTVDDKKHFFIKEDNRVIKILLEEILYFEAAVDYIQIYTVNGKHMTLFSLRQVEEEVPGDQFIRIHRGFIVNRAYVEAIEGRTVLIGGKKLAISRSLFDDVYDKIVGGKLWRK